MKHLIILIPLLMTTLLLAVTWSGWETIYPLWSRILVSVFAILMIVVTLRFRKFAHRLPVQANIFAGMTLLWGLYLLPFANGRSVLHQFFDARHHLANPADPIISIDEFAAWLDEGDSLHQYSPWTQSRYRETAEKRLLQSLQSTQAYMQSSDVEIRRYVQWNQRIANLDSRLPAGSQYVQRMKKILRQSELFQEIYSEFRVSILRGDRQAAAFCIQRLQKEFDESVANTHIGLMVRRMIGMAEFLKIDPNSTASRPTIAD